MRRLVVNVDSGAYYDVYVGRGSIWGNPYTHQPIRDTKALYQVATRAEAIEAYESWVQQQDYLMSRLPELKGKILACHCWPYPCHAEVLVRLANMEREE